MVHITPEYTYESYRVSATYTDLPVTLERVRQHLRNEDLNYDDDYVIGLIRAAAKTVEGQYGLSLLTQTIVETHRKFPGYSHRPVMLRVHPLIAVSSVQYTDADGNTQTWVADEYYSGRYMNMSFIAPKVGYQFPSTLADRPGTVTVTYTAGFGNKASDVPTDIQTALLLIIGKLYTNREDPTQAMPTASDALLAPYLRFPC